MGRAVARLFGSTVPAVGWLAGTFTNDLITAFFPAECRVCGEPLLQAGSLPVCAACVSEVPSQDGGMCGRCGGALGFEIDLEDKRFLGMLAEGVLCTACRLVPPAFARAVAYGVYDAELREMVHLLKYERMAGIARPLGEYLAAAVLPLEAIAARELMVVAVPLFPAREAQRGYNQSVLLGDRAVEVLRKSKPGWRLTVAHRALVRVKDTESQYVLSPRGRRQNLKGAFLVPDEALVAGREILLVDDIFTTGSTARECARVLRRAGAAKVWVATLSRAQAYRLKPMVDPAQDVAIWGS